MAATLPARPAQQPAVPPPLAHRPRAAHWPRLAARVIDLATVLTVLWGLVVLQVFWFMGDLSSRVDPAPWGRGFVPTVFFVVMLGAYEIVFLVHSRGQTPGMDIMKLRVVALDGAPVTVGRATRRWLVAGLLLFLTPLWLAALGVGATGLPVATGARRSLRDLAAGTRVVAYDRDHEDEAARRPSSRRARREEREAHLLAGHDDDATTAIGSPQ
jgi:uncharacterized RDD family membrane protein YckC